jgi:hypothetical protein
MPVTNTEINVKGKLPLPIPFFVDKTFLVGIVSKSNTEISNKKFTEKGGFYVRKEKDQS